MEFKLKTISESGIAEAIAKAQLYRYLSEPEEAESICRDILAIDPENQIALRTLALAVTDQFNGSPSDRHAEVEGCCRRLRDAYERHYYTGIFHERRARAQMRAGRAPQMLMAMFGDAMWHFEEAEKLRPPENDDAVLRWNSCARRLQELTKIGEEQEAPFEAYDSAPTEFRRRAG